VPTRCPTLAKLSDTQRVILSRAAQHDALMATPPTKLSAAARQGVLHSMIATGLLQEVPAPREALALGWRQERGWRLGRAAHHRRGTGRDLCRARGADVSPGCG
jgi:hypothetical protein